MAEPRGSIDRTIHTKGTASTHSHSKELANDISRLARFAKEVKQEIFCGKEVSEYMTTMTHEPTQTREDRPMRIVETTV